MGNLIFKLNGGTGNQLFQAATAISLAKICNKGCQFHAKDINKLRIYLLDIIFQNWMFQIQ